MDLLVEVAYWFWFFAMALSFAYTLAFERATLHVGRLLSRTNSGTGAQDAITPPSHTSSAHSLAFAWFFGAIWWIFLLGWIAGIAGWLGPLIAGAIVSGFLPKKDSSFFLQRISRSMFQRRIAYVARGDRLRAEEMSVLIDRLNEGFPNRNEVNAA